MASMMSTYSWLKFTDVPLLTMGVVMCAQTSIQKDQVVLPHIDMSFSYTPAAYRDDFTFSLSLFFLPR